MDDEDLSSIQLNQTLFQSPGGVYFYQIPTHASTLDPRAEHWNPDRPLLTGSLEVLQQNDACFIKLYEPEPPKDSGGTGPKVLFAQAPVQIDRDHELSLYVQDCSDSSRYFVLRVEDEKTKRHAFIGIGFPDRSDAFNFKASLQDYVRYRQRQDEAQVSSLGPKKDLSLPQGQKIHIALQGKKKPKKSSLAGAKATGSSMLLAPPPRDAAVTIRHKTDTKETTTKKKNQQEDEDWGDFQ